MSVPSKQRDVTQMERVINSLNQDLPSTKEWNELFDELKKQATSCQLTSRLHKIR